MYEAFYGFREKPFNLTPDPKFLYLSAKHNEAFAHLEFGLRQRGGFMVITGEVGTGKTTLCRYFLDRLDEDTVSAFILYPALGTTELLRSVNRDLGITPNGDSDKELIDALHTFLLDSRRHGKNIVLVIDEAQNLSRDVLEQVRLISNLETDTEKLIQIVLIGQSELNDVLAQRDLRQLAQRVTARYHLTPLSREEMTRYIHHRLVVAGGSNSVQFTPGAIRAARRFSKGVPRLINLVCDRALLAAYVLEQRRITPSIVHRAIGELNMPEARPWYRHFGWGMTSLLASLGLVIGLFALGSIGVASFLPSAFFGGSSNDGDVASPARDAADFSEQFELRLVSLSDKLSHRAASAVLLELWGFRLGGGLSAISKLEDMPSLATRASLQYVELETSFDQLRALNMPAVLEVHHPSQEHPRFVTLTALAGDAAIVYFAPGDYSQLSLEVLKEFWTGRARLFWRDFDDLESADVARRLAWARGHLSRIGFLDDSDMTSAVRALQQRVLLEPTGSIGQDTRMALYSLTGGYRMPRLKGP